MTVTTTENLSNQSGNGSTTQFFFTFKVLDETHLKFYIDDVLQGSGYTVDLNADQDASAGGSVTFTIPPLAGTTLTILRDVPATQLTDYTAYDAFPAETHEDALDKLTMLYQQSLTSSDRAIKIELSDVGAVTTDLPPADAGKSLVWNSTGTQLVNSAIDFDEVDSSVEANANAAAASAAESAASAALAQQWAVNPEDVPVSGGEFSSYHWAQKAEEFAQQADAAGVIIQDNAPSSPQSGLMWVDSSNSDFVGRVWYEDGTSNQWIQVFQPNQSAPRFTDLPDVPSTFSLSPNKFLKVNSTGTGIVFSDAVTGRTTDINSGEQGQLVAASDSGVWSYLTGYTKRKFTHSLPALGEGYWKVTLAYFVSLQAKGKFHVEIDLDDVPTGMVITNAPSPLYSASRKKPNDESVELEGDIDVDERGTGEVTFYVRVTDAAGVAFPAFYVNNKRSVKVETFNFTSKLTVERNV